MIHKSVQSFDDSKLVIKVARLRDVRRVRAGVVGVGVVLQLHRLRRLVTFSAQGSHRAKAFGAAYWADMPLLSRSSLHPPASFHPFAAGALLAGALHR